MANLEEVRGKERGGRIFPSACSLGVHVNIDTTFVEGGNGRINRRCGSCYYLKEGLLDSQGAGSLGYKSYFGY